MARIGTVGYLNARPLSDHVSVDRHTLVLAHPAEVARMLREREVDVALVPVAAVLGDPELRVVPQVCVGSNGPVHSVVLVAETPPEAWTRVVLDGVSRTSVVLAQLLLKHGPLAERVPPNVEIVLGAPNSALPLVKKTVAGLVIGDQARTVSFAVRIDLAEVWREWTGLPFVFAVWAGRPDLDPSVVAHLVEAGRVGLAEVATRYSGADLEYLTRNIRHVLDDAALMGLRRFGALAYRAGLLPGEDVELYGPATRTLPRPNVDALVERALVGGALPHADLLDLLRFAPLADLAAAADLKRREHYPGTEVPYTIRVVLAADEAPASVAWAVERGATRVRLVGRVTPERVQAVRAGWPTVEIEGEGDDPAALAAAGLTHWTEESVGAWSDRVRGTLGGGPIAHWLDGAERAARAGLVIAASIGVGQGESDEELVGQILRLRDLPGLRYVRVWAAEGAGTYGSRANTATDHLRVLTIARLVLPGKVHLQASPSTEGLGVTQASVRSGCDHGGVLEVAVPANFERVTALEHHLAEIGLQAARR